MTNRQCGISLPISCFIYNIEGTLCLGPWKVEIKTTPLQFFKSWMLGQAKNLKILVCFALALALHCQVQCSIYEENMVYIL